MDGEAEIGPSLVQHNTHRAKTSSDTFAEWILKNFKLYGPFYGWGQLPQG